jgi:alpha-L-rhamnosidase
MFAPVTYLMSVRVGVHARKACKNESFKSDFLPFIIRCGAAVSLKTIARTVAWLQTAGFPSAVAVRSPRVEPRGKNLSLRRYLVLGWIAWMFGGGTLLHAERTPVPSPAVGETASLIREAVPVWAAGREKEMNLNLAFRGVFQMKKRTDAVLRLTASTIYRVYVNGSFVGSGPARGPHGYYRVDEYEIGNRLKAGENIIAVEVAGYNVNSYYTLDQPSFLLAEVEAAGKIVLATGKKGRLEAFQRGERLQKVERYSFQRPFTEYYRVSEGYDRWRTSTLPATTATATAVKLTNYPPVALLPRNVALPGFEKINPVAVYAKGSMKKITPQTYYKDRSLVHISESFKGYPEAALEVYPVSQEIQELATDRQEVLNHPATSAMPLSLKEKEFCTCTFAANYSGFIGARLHCPQQTRLLFYFDETLREGDVRTKQRMADVNNEVVYELEPGAYEIETLEAYTLKYLKVIVLSGECRLDDLYMREFAYPENKAATFDCSNTKLNRIYEAARQTSRQNAVDVFTDCPSRERAGWLCDSYFAAIMEKEFTGYSAIAHNFYENYALPDHFQYLPEGMIPMCYPADHPDRVFIPQWSLWFVLQVADYKERGGDERLIARLKPRIEKLLAYFATFENADGLLEKLDSWNFVEWSRANSLVHDVNYPTNMLYSAALKAAGRLYDRAEWQQKAAHLKQQILLQSFQGDFFTDNAVREDGRLKNPGNTTEVCQYYAFFFDIATPDTHPALWQKLTTAFGPDRNEATTYPNVSPANAFMGNYMRMDILSRYGLQRQMLSEIQDYFYRMADLTGTLWEHMRDDASCNHGFASYLGHVLYRDVLGIRHIDYIRKEITVCFHDLPLDRCSGAIPIGEELLELKWERSGDRITYSLSAPKAYRIKIENRTPATLTARPSAELYSQTK